MTVTAGYSGLCCCCVPCRTRDACRTLIPFACWFHTSAPGLVLFPIKKKKKIWNAAARLACHAKKNLTTSNLLIKLCIKHWHRRLFYLQCARFKLCTAIHRAGRSRPGLALSTSYLERTIVFDNGMGESSGCVRDSSVKKWSASANHFLLLLDDQRCFLYDLIISG